MEPTAPASGSAGQSDLLNGLRSMAQPAQPQQGDDGQAARLRLLQLQRQGEDVELAPQGEEENKRFSADTEARWAAQRKFSQDPALQAEITRFQNQPPAPPAEDPRRWTGANTALEGGMLGAMLGDYLQTRQIAKKGMETNPVMGQRGQRVSPNVYFPLAALLHVGASYGLSHPWREAFQIGTAGAQVANDARSESMGWPMFRGDPLTKKKR